MKTKTTFLLSLLIFLGTLSVRSQVIENDSTVVIGIEELRTITKMTEELRYTKAELEVADSIIHHQKEIIRLKDQTIDLKTTELQKNIKKSYQRQIKTGVICGVSGIILGVLLGIFL